MVQLDPVVHGVIFPYNHCGGHRPEEGASVGGRWLVRQGALSGYFGSSIGGFVDAFRQSFARSAAKLYPRPIRSVARIKLLRLSV